MYQSLELEVRNLSIRSREAEDANELIEIFNDAYNISNNKNIEYIELIFSKLKLKIIIKNTMPFNAPLIELNKENSVINYFYSAYTVESALKFIKDCL
jgi:hypothetical protein